MYEVRVEEVYNVSAKLVVDGKECEQIIVKTVDGELLAVIADGKVVEKNGVVVEFDWLA